MEYKVGTDPGKLFCTSEATEQAIEAGVKVTVKFDAVGPVLLPEST